MSKTHSKDNMRYYQAGLIVIVLASLGCIVAATITILGLQNSPPPVEGVSVREQQLENAIKLLSPNSIRE